MVKHYRIPDVLDHEQRILGEVKNVGYQALTSQLQDFLAYSESKGYTSYLWVRAGDGTTLSGPLQALEDEGKIVVLGSIK